MSVGIDQIGMISKMEIYIDKWSCMNPALCYSQGHSKTMILSRIEIATQLVDSKN